MSHNADEMLTLASILSDLGAECCEKATLVDVLTQLGPSMVNKEQQIARALFMMCIVREESSEVSSTTAHWDASVFLLAVREAFPNIDFSQVLIALDFPHFTIKSPSAAEALLEAFKAVYHVPESYMDGIGPNILFSLEFLCHFPFQTAIPTMDQFEGTACIHLQFPAAFSGNHQLQPLSLS